MQGYTDGPIVPAYAKTGSISLTQIGWGRAYTGGFALRPEIPNAKAVQRTLMRYAENLHCKPPYHPDGLVPMHFVQASFPAPEPDNLTFAQRFLYRRYLRQARTKAQSLDTVPIPTASNS